MVVRDRLRQYIPLVIGLALIMVSLYFIDYSIRLLGCVESLYDIVASILSLIVSLIVFLSGLVLIRDYVYTSSLEEE